MNKRNKILSYLSYGLIFIIQVPFFIVGFDWYPQILERMLEWRQAGGLSGSESLLWNISMAVIVTTPVLILVAPYRIAWAFWHRVKHWSWHNSY